eukprot:TRINITY_DN57803_c0_g2_i1.p1 TRINITY_DN57803_c0_g2~~TRINITY_DN57803_c0_g2_i1.p1  ORF type:complete len:284 (+),score=7.38 TRINITY_DN57803_c0_g2_i1:275-1126(+)
MLRSNKPFDFKNIFKRSSKVAFILFMLASIAFVGSSCESQKKAAARQAAEKKAAAIKKAKSDLEALINDTNKTPDQKQKELDAIKRRGIKDPAVLALIKDAQDKINKEKEELKAKKEKEEKEAKLKSEKDKIRNLLKDGNVTLDEKEKELNRIKGLNLNDPEIQDLIKKLEDNIAAEKKAKENAKEVQPTLQEFFEGVVNSGSTTSANKKIQNALGLFASDDIPVLIVISRSGGVKDYDRPTTIRKYLEYLKDQKINPNDVENVVYDGNGKIKELELIKKSIK